MNDVPTPAAAGFRMPPEWAPHERTWMMWPRRLEVWDDIGATRRNYAEVAHAIRRFEPLAMVVHPEDSSAARGMLGADIDLFEHPIDDSWARDAGPCFLLDDAGTLAGVSFEFNAWGGKYTPFDGDNSVSSVILDHAGARIFRSSLIAEGGGISVDGEGTILTTRSCFPNANRNPDWSQDDIERELCAMLGGEKVIWLPGNALETETDGHVDGVAVFAAPGTVIIQDTGPAAHPWHDVHLQNLDAARNATDARNRPLSLIPMPDAIDAQPGDGIEICDSYVNFYICNGAIIAPKYGLREDRQVAEILSDIFPEREIVMVDLSHIALGGGGIHCITQQEPKRAPSG